MAVRCSIYKDNLFDNLNKRLTPIATVTHLPHQDCAFISLYATVLPAETRRQQPLSNVAVSSVACLRAVWGEEDHVGEKGSPIVDGGVSRELAGCEGGCEQNTMYMYITDRKLRSVRPCISHSRVTSF